MQSYLQNERLCWSTSVDAVVAKLEWLAVRSFFLEQLPTAPWYGGSGPGLGGQWAFSTTTGLADVSTAGCSSTCLLYTSTSY